MIQNNFQKNFNSIENHPISPKHGLSFQRTSVQPSSKTMRRKETRLPPRRFLEETSRRQSIRATGKDHLVHRHVMPDQTAPRADSCRSLPTSPNEQIGLQKDAGACCITHRYMASPSRTPVSNHGGKYRGNQLVCGDPYSEKEISHLRE